VKAPEGGVVSSVVHGSLAEAAGVVPGDTIVAIDGRVLRDAVDYQFYAAEHEITARFRKADGSEDLIVFEKEPDEDLGLGFERATWDGVQVCNNTCFFCFLKGLPKGLRKPLYLKDDDYRLSFLHGNFVTLTNLTEDDWTRLEEQRLSPLNVSVHATEVELRRALLGNERAPDVVAQLERLRDLGLQAHTQIVLTPGMNDGEALERSLGDLTGLYPTVQTVSVVPVGASPRLEEWSRDRDGIELLPPEREFARGLIATIRRFQRACEDAHGASVVQCADEYYLAAGRPVPSARRYDGFPQYENGIGMVRTLTDDWSRLRRRLRRKPSPGVAAKRVAMACGTLIGPTLARLAGEFGAETGIDVSVHPVTNTLFGERVNVSGLLSGGDYVRTLAGLEADLVLLPRTSLDYFGERFLDSMTVAEVAEGIGAPVAFATSMSEAFEAIQAGPHAPDKATAPNGAFWSDTAIDVPVEGVWAQG
jgi:putative radical SAM enzyme (TIGR03279 family)